MRKNKLLLTLVLVLVSLVVFVGCGKNGCQTFEVEDPSFEMEDLSYSVKVEEAPDAIFLGGYEFVSASQDGETLSDTEYMVKNGYFAFKYETYAEMGTNLNQYTITLDKGSFNLSYFVSGYEGEFAELGGAGKLVINEDMTCTVGSEKYDVFIKGEEIKLKQNGEVKKSGRFGDEVVVLDKLYGKETFENKVSVISGVEISTKDFKIFDKLGGGDCSVSYTLVEGANSIDLDTLDVYTLDCNKNYQLKTNFKSDVIDATLITPVSDLPFSEIDFALEQEKYQLFSANVENKQYENQPVMALKGMALLDNEIINKAKRAGYWTITLDVLVPNEETVDAGFMAHGHMAGGNIYNALPTSEWFCTGSETEDVTNASYVKISNYKGNWHTLYLDITRFHTDTNNPESIFFYYNGEKEIYIKNLKFHYVQQDLSKDLDLETYGQYAIIPTFTGSVRGISPASWDETNQRLVLTNVNGSSSTLNSYSLLQGYLEKGFNDGYKNIDVNFGGNGTETRIGQYFLWHWQGLAVFDALTGTSNAKSYDLTKINDKINPVKNVGTSISDLNALSREDIRLTIQTYNGSSSCSSYVNKIGFSK